MATPKKYRVHMTVGREGTECGSGGANPAFTTRDPEKVTCPQCKRRMNSKKET